jgi:pimeloyl-ACP methyl ester carboxylesterase
MTDRPAIAFVCAHLCDERLYAAQRAALDASHDCRVFVLRDEDTLAAMAGVVLAAMPPRFTLIGLSLGGYVAFEIVRRALGRVARLALPTRRWSPIRRSAPAAWPTSPPSRQRHRGADP